MSTAPSRIGAYEIVRRLGSGGMGTVYLGRDPELDRPVAIKVLREQVHDQELLERFFREARAAAALRHPNIITIYASGQHDFQPFIAMEFVDGESLAEVIRRQKPLTLSEKLSYIEQLCAGLHFAHRAGIVHRDIKPANLMVDREGVIRILDFGIARVEGSGMTRDGAMIGTLNYMSPEQMLGRPVDHRSDIFAVGAVAYEILCYQQAFKGGLNDGLLQRLPHEDPPALKDLCIGVPPGLEQAVMRALQKAPDSRFRDLAEMRAALVDVRRQLETDANLATIVVRPTPGQAGRPPSSRASGVPPTGSSQQDALGLLNQPRETRDLTVRQRLTEASVHLQKGDAPAAVRLLQQVIAIDPGNRTATEMLARAQTATAGRFPSRAGTADGFDIPLDRGTLADAPPAVSPRTPVVPIAVGAVVVIGALAAIPWWLMSRDELPPETIASGEASVATGAATLSGVPTDAPDASTASPPATAQLPAAPAETTTGTAPAIPASAPARETPPPAAPPQVQPPRQTTTTPPAGRGETPAPSPPPAAAAGPSPAELAAENEIQNVLARVNAMFLGGDFAGALDLLAKNPDTTGDERIRTVANRVTSAAFDAMASAERDATTRNAAQFAADTLRLATDAKGRADSFRQRGDLVNAGLNALSARTFFQQAATDALTRRNQQQQAAASPQPSAVTTPAPTPTPVPAPSASDRERPGIIAALGRWQAAHRDGDIKAALTVFPNLRREAQQALQRSFNDCRPFEWDFSDERFLMDEGDPTTVQVNLRSTYTCTPRTGQRPQPAAQREIFTLRKRGDAWYIEGTAVTTN
ncbi:MAG: protein kinase [Acidobacteria bacterium]|nr:protein kinase [Acidobacteriota bacterium]